MQYHIEFDREADGRWIADVPELPGVMAYGKDQEEANAKVEALALRVLADKIEKRLTPRLRLSLFASAKQQFEEGK